jgi:RNA polymerase sigma-70 factor, ECF subfamily
LARNPLGLQRGVGQRRYRDVGLNVGTPARDSSAPAGSSEGGSFEAFFREQYPRLVRAIAVATGSSAEAEDLVQEAMARAYDRWAKVAHTASPGGYVYVVALNAYRSRRRRAARAAGRVLASSTGEEELDAAACRIDLLRAVRALPDGQRDALLLVDWLDLSMSQAAEVLGIEPVSVRSRVHRARLAVRPALEAMG